MQKFKTSNNLLQNARALTSLKIKEGTFVRALIESKKSVPSCAFTSTSLPNRGTS